MGPEHGLAVGECLADLQLAAAAAKYARGRLLAGADGDRWTREADDWFASQDVLEPHKLLRIVLPGFPGL